MANQEILLGYGVFSIDETPIGLTRGGGSFTVETEYREIEADGDKGAVKGRIVIDRQDASLTINALTAFSKEQFVKYYPALSEDLGVVTSTLEILDTDYKTITWAGKTMEGKAVTIEIENAINMDNLELTLEDKNEVVPELTYTATYLETARDTAPWKVTFEEVV